MDRLSASAERVEKSLIGVIDMVIPHEPFFYKELEVTISRAGGPGRYDPSFERMGNAYPRQYVRWSETDNLASFLHLMATEKVNVKPLISEIIPVSGIEKAYERVLAGA